MNSTPNHYAVLELTSDATDAEIKRRYRKLMRAVHPDANANDPQATRKAARLNVAFETLGDAEKRRAYDALHHPRARATSRRKHYEHVAEQPDWEDIVAASVPSRKTAHVHNPLPVIAPDEIEIDMAELREQARVRRRVTVTNRCDCTLIGNVSTSEPWVWGPVGRLTVPPGASIEFDVEIVARKVTFPGISRVIFVTKDWTGVVPVKITGYAPKLRRTYPATETAYVAPRRRRAVRTR